MSGSGPPDLTVSSNGIGVVPDALLNTYAQSGAVVADLRNFPAVTRMQCWLIGTSAPNDGGQKMFYFDATATTTDDNGVTCIAPYGLLAGRWLRQSPALAPVIINVVTFGAKGDGVTNDSAAFQAAINAACAAHGSVYVPAAKVYYLIGTPLNVTNCDQILIYGDGPFPPYNRITPVGGSVLAGNTGTGQPIMDAMGTNGLILRDLTFGTIGMTAPSTYGVLMGDSTRVTNVPGGSSNVLENVTFLMAPTGSSCAVYGVNCNLTKFLNVQTISDYSLFITNANDLSVTPPYGTFGPNIQSDGIYSQGCSLGGYGTQIPLILKNANNSQWNQLYIVNVNGSGSYAGEAFAIKVDSCTDITMKVEIDYFPSAVVMLGACIDIRLTGIIFQSTTPVPTGLPGIASFQGLSLDGCIFGIRPLQNLTANSNYLYGTMSVSATMNFINNCTFVFDISITPNTAFLDMTAFSTTPLFNNYFNGNSDTVGNSYEVNGAPLGAGGYRVFVNGLRTGSA